MEIFVGGVVAGAMPLIAAGDRPEELGARPRTPPTTTATTIAATTRTATTRPGHREDRGRRRVWWALSAGAEPTPVAPLGPVRYGRDVVVPPGAPRPFHGVAAPGHTVVDEETSLAVGKARAGRA